MDRFWIVRCNSEDAAKAWPAALPLLAEAIAAAGECFLPEDIQANVTAPLAGTERGWSLWLLGEGDTLHASWVTKVEFYPRTRILLTIFGGGGGVIGDWWPTALQAMDETAIAWGCSRLRCMGRRGWGRGKGYQTSGFIHDRVPPMALAQEAAA